MQRIGDRRVDSLLPQPDLNIANSFGIAQNKSWDGAIINIVIIEVEATLFS